MAEKNNSNEAQKKKSIFIVDDDKFLLDMYALKFKETGFEVFTSLSSADAILFLKEKKSPDIILIDIVMPGMDGFDLLKKIKTEKLSERSLVIMLSNLGQEGDIERAKQLGAEGYIVKASATPGEIVKKIIEYLENQGAKRL
ncbi:MAG: response regulator [bacterium]|nr:response regulator [bacterium]